MATAEVSGACDEEKYPEHTHGYEGVETDQIQRSFNDNYSPIASDWEDEEGDRSPHYPSGSEADAYDKADGHMYGDEYGSHSCGTFSDGYSDHASNCNEDHGGYSSHEGVRAKTKTHETPNDPGHGVSVNEKVESQVGSPFVSQERSAANSFGNDMTSNFNKTYSPLNSSEQSRRPSISPSASEQLEKDIKTSPKPTAETVLSSAAPSFNPPAKPDKEGQSPADPRASVAARAAPVHPSFAEAGFSSIPIARDTRRDGVQRTPPAGGVGVQKPFIAPSPEPKVPEPPKESSCLPMPMPKPAVSPSKATEAPKVTGIPQAAATPRVPVTPNTPEPSKPLQTPKGPGFPEAPEKLKVPEPVKATEALKIQPLKPPVSLPVPSVSPLVAQRASPKGLSLKDSRNGETSTGSSQPSAMPPKGPAQKAPPPTPQQPAKLPSTRSPVKRQPPPGTGIGIAKLPFDVGHSLSFDLPARNPSTPTPSGPSPNSASSPTTPDYEQGAIDGLIRSLQPRVAFQKTDKNDRVVQWAESVSAEATGALANEPPLPLYKRKVVTETVILTSRNTSPDGLVTLLSIGDCQGTSVKTWCGECEYMAGKVSTAVGEKYLTCRSRTHPIMVDCVLRGTTCQAGDITAYLSKCMQRMLDLAVPIHAVVRRAASEKHRSGKWYDLTTKEDKSGTLVKWPKKDNILQQVLFWKAARNRQMRKWKESHEASKKRDFRLMFDIPIFVAERGPVEKEIVKRLSQHSYVEVEKVKIIQAHPCLHRLAWWARTHPAFYGRKKSQNEKSSSSPYETPPNEHTGNVMNRSNSVVRPLLKSFFSGTSSTGTKERKQSTSPPSRMSPENTSSNREGNPSGHIDASNVDLFLKSVPSGQSGGNQHRRRTSAKHIDADGALTSGAGRVLHQRAHRTRHSRRHREPRPSDELTEMRVPGPPSDSAPGLKGEPA